MSDSWLERFQRSQHHLYSAPNYPEHSEVVEFSHTGKTATTTLTRHLRSPSARSTTAAPLRSLVYSLTLNSVEIIIPTIIDEALRGDKGNRLKFTAGFQLSWFDSKQGKYFGETYKSDPIPLEVGRKLVPDKDEPQASLNGRILNIDFAETEMLVHSASISPSVLIVAEFILNASSESGNQQAHEQTSISCGWTVIQPWPGSVAGLGNSAGININQYLREEDESIKERIGRKSISSILLSGSPRVLAVCCPGDVAERNLDQIFFGVINERTSSEVLKCSLAVEPGMMSFAIFVPEFFWIGPEDDVPGLQLFPVVKPVHPTTSIHFQDLSVRMPLEINQFEALFVERLRNQLEDIKDVEIIDRRLAFKLHNGYGFFNSGSSISLRPHSSQPECLQFTGSMDLDEFPIHAEQQKDLAVIAMLEYSISITHMPERAVQKKRKWLLTRKSIVNKITGTEVRNLLLGWAIWAPTTDFVSPKPSSGEYQNISVLFNSSPEAVNPFNTALYSPQLIFTSALAAENALSDGIDQRTLEMSLSFSASRLPLRETAKMQPSKQESVIESPAERKENLEPPPKPSSAAPPPPKPPAPVPTVANNKDELERCNTTDLAMDIPNSEPKASKSESEKSAKVKRNESQDELKPVQHANRQQDKENISQSSNKIPAGPVHSQVFAVNAPDSETKFVQGNNFEFTRSQLNRIGRSGVRAMIDMDGNIVPLQLFATSIYSLDSTSLSLQSLRALQTRLNNKNSSVRPALAEFGIGFLGYTPFDLSDGFRLNCVKLSFQFFNFPYSTTRRLEVISADKIGRNEVNNDADETSNNTYNWPNLFLQTEDTHDVGSYFDFQMDVSTKRPAANRQVHIHPLIRYLANRWISVDIWDDESQLLVGTARFPANFLLKSWIDSSKGLDAMNAGVHVPVYPVDWTQILSNAENGDRRYASSFETSRENPVAHLHLQLSAVFRDNHSSAAESAPLHEVEDNLMLKDYISSLQLGAVPRSRVTALRLSDADSDYKEYLQSQETEMHIMHTRKNSSVSSKSLHSRSAVMDSKMEALLQYLNERRGQQPLNNTDRTSYLELRNERIRKLQIAFDFRQEKKKYYLMSAMMDQMTTRHSIYAQPGHAYFFEFQLSNTREMDQTVEIQFNSLDLRIVTDFEEWKYLQRANGLQKKTAEKDMISMNESTAKRELWLRAKESVTIPFVFQTALTDAYGQSKIDASTINVSFVNAETKKPLAFLNLNIQPHTGIEIDQTLRFFGCEGEMLKARVKYTPRYRNQSDSDCNPAYDLTEPSRRFIRCSNDHVICNVEEDISAAINRSNGYNINLKYRCLEANPVPQQFFIYFYHDPFFANLADVWQVFVHSLHRMDVSCPYAQTNSASLILRGSDNGARGRTIKFFSTSCSDEVQFCVPKMELVGNALTEVELRIRSITVGINDILVNIVDSEKSELISGWIIRCHTAPPVITKEFSLQLPFGKPCNKRISYRNPYQTSRTFHLQTSQPKVLSFKNKKMQLDAGKSDYIHLHFNPPRKQEGTGSTDILVFIRNDQEKIEECLQIKLNFTS